MYAENLSKSKGRIFFINQCFNEDIAVAYLIIIIEGFGSINYQTIIHIYILKFKIVEFKC